MRVSGTAHSPGAQSLGVGVGAFICVIHGSRRVAAATLMAAKNHPRCASPDR